MLEKKDEHYAKVTIKDSDVGIDDTIGEVSIPLDEVVSHGKVSKWFPIHNDNKASGEVLIEISYDAEYKM